MFSQQRTNWERKAGGRLFQNRGIHYR